MVTGAKNGSAGASPSRWLQADRVRSHLGGRASRRAVPSLLAFLLLLPPIASATVTNLGTTAIFARARVIVSPDSDGDGLPDATEERLGTDPANPDTDGDGLTDGFEAIHLNTDPLAPDSDRDGWGDGAEVALGSNPMDRLSHPVRFAGTVVYTGVQTGLIWVAASVQDGAAPGSRLWGPGVAGEFLFTNLVSRRPWQVLAWRDVEADGVAAVWEPWVATGVFAPTNDVTGVTLLLEDGAVDSDGNGLIDRVEFHWFGRVGVDPHADEDDDGLSNADELSRGTHPLRRDTDGDGASDGYEVAHDLDPLTPDPPIVVSFDFSREQGALVRWNTVWSRSYMPQVRASLTTGTWVNLLPAPVYEWDEYPEGTQQVLDRGARTAPVRFYRVTKVVE